MNDRNMKNAWISPDVLNTLTLESSDVKRGLIVFDSVFPAKDPKRHIVAIKNLTDEDLIDLYYIIGSYLLRNKLIEGE